MSLTAGGAGRVEGRTWPDASPTPSDHATAAVPFPRTSRAANVAVLGLFVASLVWALSHRSTLESVGEHASRVVVAGVFLVVAAAISVVSIVLLGTISVGQLVERGRSDDGWRWRSLRRNAEGTLTSVVDHRWFMTGWMMNCFGVFLPMIVFIVFIFTTLPRTSWGLALAPAVDLLLSLLLRIPIHLHICRVRGLRSQSAGVP